MSIRSGSVRGLFLRAVLATLAVTATAPLASVMLNAQQRVTPASAPARSYANSDALVSDQLRAHPELATAFALVESLHGNWMRERGVRPLPARRVPDVGRSVAGENGGVQVYLDGHRLGGTELLRSIPSKGIYSIHHLSGIQAQSRFGAGHSEGVIWVATIPAWDRIK